ncbi:PAS domain-containing protein [Humitalea rosea]|uniref:PAS domain-containing protein n=1 Tax=Humitalea rosea TaxID=990373 RepID=UPI000DAEB0CD|nr:PAS domain-containing protein [Humitalea rosea]
MTERLPPHRPSRFVHLLPYAAVLIPMMLLGAGAELSWLQVWRDARSDLQRAAEGGADYGNRILSGYALAAGRINELLRGLSDAEIHAREAELHGDLAKMVAEVPQGIASHVMDRDGVPLLSATLFPVPRNETVVADRDFFLALKAADAPDVHISAVHVGHFEGRPFFAVSRRRQNTGNGLPRGSFDGIVNLSVEPATLADGMRRVLGDEAVIGLVRADGAVLVHTNNDGGNDGGPPARLPADSPILGAMQGDGFAIETRSPFTGDAQIIAARQLPGFPIYALASRSRDSIIQQWWSGLLPHLALGLPMTLALLLLSLRVRRDQQRLTADNSGLTSALLESEAWLRRVQRIGRVGGFEIDLPTGVNRRSPEYMALQGMAAEPRTEQHDDWVARLHPEDRERAQAAFLYAIESPGTTTTYAQEYRIVTPEGGIRWTAARAEIERDAKGRALRMVGAHLDITALKQTEQALAESEARFRQIAETIDEIFYVAEPSTGRMRYVSPAWARITGHPATAPQNAAEAWLAAVHPEDRERVRAARREGPYDIEYRMLRADGGERRLHDRAFAVPDPMSGAAARVTGVARDVTEERQATEIQALLAAEVDHRAKNVLAVVQSVIRLTRAATVPDFAAAIEGRVAALARAHSLLARGRWIGSELNRMVEEELAAHDVGDRFRTSGPMVVLIADAVQPMSMVLHELATNAAKYGALSARDGRIDIDWVLLPGGKLRLTWSESGGPVVSEPPTGRGFGSTLIEATVAGQLKGEFERDWSRFGLRAIITIDVTMLQPYVAAPQPLGVPHAAPHAVPRNTGMRGRRILLAEDETLIALELRDIIEELGCELVGPARTPDEAFALIAQAGRLDAAVLDVNLGGRQIFPVAEKLRQRGVPMVFTTGYSNLPSEQTQGAPVLRKPLARGELVAALTALLAPATAEG